MADRLSDAAWDQHDEGIPYRAGSQDLTLDRVDEFFAGEPIAGRPRGRSRLRKLSIGIIGLASAWGAATTNDVWQPWLTATVERFTVEWARQNAPALPAKAAQPPLSTVPAPIEPLTDAKEVAAIAGTAANPPGVDPATPITHAETSGAEIPGTNAPPSSPSQNTAPAPLPEIQVESTDPYQLRAKAIGLHPQISRAVLASLSDADFRNARTAIKRALAEASDTDKFVWPKQPQPSKAAVFQVHFVNGDRTDCRRYIVTILKNGWTTTASPMEKCGLTPPKRSAGMNNRPNRNL